MSVRAELDAMTSGECRWIGRHDLHVYCWAPCDAVQSDGKTRWIRRQPSFRIDTAAEWLDSESAAVAVEKHLMEERYR